MDADTIARVRQSYGRCIAQPDFMEGFYSNFLSSSPEIPAMFQNTNFSKQKTLLKDSIALVFMFAKDDKNTSVRKQLLHIGERHSRSQLNVAAHLYPFWINSLIKTISIYDTKFSPELEKEWRAIAVVAIEFLKSWY